MPIYCHLINCVALVFGGIVDFRRREIPNLVPLALLVSGILRGGKLVEQLVLTLVIAAILILSPKTPEQELPGGDFKLICALTFSIGLFPLMETILVAGALVLLVSFIMRLPVKRHIPLCAYVAPAYFVTFATSFL